MRCSILKPILWSLIFVWYFLIGGQEITTYQPGPFDDDVACWTAYGMTSWVAWQPSGVWITSCYPSSIEEWDSRIIR